MRVLFAFAQYILYKETIRVEPVVRANQEHQIYA